MTRTIFWRIVSDSVPRQWLPVAPPLHASLMFVRPLLTIARLVSISTVRGATVLNVALTAWSELIVTVHVPVPEQPAPAQPAKVDPAAGVAVNVTMVPLE